MVSQGNNPVAVIKGIQQANEYRSGRCHSKEHRSGHERHPRTRRNGEGHLRADHHPKRSPDPEDHPILAEEAMLREGLGRPPVPYAWIALGSEGRREQTLRTDQDNAIVFADVPPEKEEEVQRFFLDLAGRVVSGLERCGFPRCKGGIHGGQSEMVPALSGLERLLPTLDCRFRLPFRRDPSDDDLLRFPADLRTIRFYDRDHRIYFRMPQPAEELSQGHGRDRRAS